MNIPKIMVALKKDPTWTAQGEDAPTLAPCIFCGGSAEVVVRTPMYGRCGAWVRCRSCYAYGPKASIYAQFTEGTEFCTPMLPESLERGINAAVDAWNIRAVDHSRMGNMHMEVRA